MDMSLMCDIRFAGRYLPRIVRTAQALRLLWTGAFVGAQEALSIGLVSEFHEDGRVLDATLELTAEIASRALIAVEIIKRSVRRGQTHDLPTALDLISSHQAVVSTEDSAEAFPPSETSAPPLFG
jgi:enoyl-CoA hydratase/carnithine racemase